MNIEMKASEWQRGTPGFFLKNGRRCILGHVFKALGVANVALENRGSIAELPLGEMISKVPDELYNIFRAVNLPAYAVSSTLAVCLTDANDNPKISDEQRLELFDLYLSRMGYSLTFIDDSKEPDGLPHHVDTHERELVA